MNGFIRYEYKSMADAFEDWAMIKPPLSGKKHWIVMIHGHGSNGDQLLARQDLREKLLPLFLNTGFGILCPNLRGNAWMCPKAVHDMHQLVSYVRNEYSASDFIFYSGSMGGTSNLIYSIFHPEDVSVLVALGAVSDIEEYLAWCDKRTSERKVLGDIASSIRSFYGSNETLYKSHSPIHNIGKYTMPVFLSHGENDALMPVSQMRNFAGKFKVKKDLIFREIPEGDHDSPLWLAEAFEWACNSL